MALQGEVLARAGQHHRGARSGRHSLGRGALGAVQIVGRSVGTRIHEHSDGAVGARRPSDRRALVGVGVAIGRQGQRLGGRVRLVGMGGIIGDEAACHFVAHAVAQVELHTLGQARHRGIEVQRLGEQRLGALLGTRGEHEDLHAMAAGHRIDQHILFHGHVQHIFVVARALQLRAEIHQLLALGQRGPVGRRGAVLHHAVGHTQGHHVSCAVAGLGNGLHLVGRSVGGDHAHLAIQHVAVSAEVEHGIGHGRYAVRVHLARQRNDNGAVTQLGAALVQSCGSHGALALGQGNQRRLHLIHCVGCHVGHTLDDGVLQRVAHGSGALGRLGIDRSGGLLGGSLVAFRHRAVVRSRGIVLGGHGGHLQHGAFHQLVGGDHVQVVGGGLVGNLGGHRLGRNRALGAGHFQNLVVVGHRLNGEALFGGHGEAQLVAGGHLDGALDSAAVHQQASVLHLNGHRHRSDADTVGRIALGLDHARGLHRLVGHRGTVHLVGHGHGRGSERRAGQQGRQRNRHHLALSAVSCVDEALYHLHFHQQLLLSRRCSRPVSPPVARAWYYSRHSSQIGDNFTEHLMVEKRLLQGFDHEVIGQ